jgi:16S rRNA (uracil1498-N3)-methyltransferase
MSARVQRVFTYQTLAAGIRVTLEHEAAHHVATVLRMRVGETIILFNEGTECEGRIAQLGKHGVSIAVERLATVSRESPLRITLAQGVSRGERMDYTIQKAVELGVFAIAPIITQRTTVKLDEERADKRHEHWRRIIIGACEQSGRNHLPQLLPIASLDDWLQATRPGVKILLRGDAELSLASVASDGDTTLLIGPEGGMAASEVTAAERAGYIAVRLGPRTLRTETAALAAIAAIQVLHGDFR